MAPIYNHCDPPEKQIPLPLKQRELSRKDLSISNGIEKRISIPTTRDKRIIISLYTDSTHLAKFFAENWPTETSSTKPDATIIALKKSAIHYGLEKEFDESRWFDPKTNQVWLFGNEFYGNIKITVRGLCSKISPLEQMFLHGCSLAIDGRGVVLSGVSGAGKTTLTTALRKILGSRIQVVNDDWGPCSLIDGQLQFTGEPHLHMKYSSVRTLAPHLTVSPSSHLSENFHNDTNDPRARLLIAAQQVFGDSGLLNEAELKLFVVVTRNPTMPARVQFLSEQDIALFEQSQHSKFYNRTEWFLNGSLFLVDDAHKKRERDRHQMLLKNFPCISVNNIVEPKETAERILTALEKLSSS